MLLWIALGVLGVVALSVGLYFIFKSPGGAFPASGLPGRAVIDPNNIDNTRMWAAEAVNRLKDVESRKDVARTNSEISRVEKELKDSLSGKQIRWAFLVEAVDAGEVKLDTFFGTSAGEFRGDDPKLKGRPMRRLSLRVYFAAEQDAVMVGDEVTPEEANRLQKGSKWTVVRTVTEVTLTKNNRWVSASSYSNVVDVLEPYCVTIVLSRK